ncbi:hypothetical protein KM043_016477 [Ampulex compressa]|nr:hypothetical protein KM043_016477 [Ampulex compressa]
MIVSEVNQLLHRNYSLICFNALNSQELLYVLRDVVAKIQGDREVDSKMSPEQMAVYILSVLRICKYEPQIDPVQFRQGLIRGDSETINPILEWLLTHIDLVKKRCYLSRFLVKVEVPMEYLSNPEISSLYEQYLSLVDRFKVVHKERDVGNKNIYTATELTADLQIMEKEKEAVTARIEKMTVKVKSAMELLDCAHALRMEKDRERDLAVQKEQEREAVTSMQMSLQIIERELQTLERNENEMSVESLIRHLGEEITVQTTIVKEQLPAVMSTRKRQIKALLTVNETAYLTPEYITALKSTFDTTVKGIQNLLELKISKIDTDRMEPFRQQVAAVGNMKRNVLAKLEICDNTLLDIRRKFEEQREQSKILTEEIVPKGEELKKYIMRLKNRSTLYKHYKSELAALTAENSVLYRTAAILENQLKQSDGNGKLLQQVEENLSDDLTRENVFSINQQLSQSMSAFYAKLAPLISDASLHHQ